MYDTKIFCPKVDLVPEKTPPKLGTSTLFGWISELYNISDQVIIDKGGYDVLFFIRFYRLSLKILVCFSVYALGVLLPINGYVFVLLLSHKLRKPNSNTCFSPLHLFTFLSVLVDI